MARNLFIRYGNFLFHSRNLLFPVVLALLVFLTRPVPTVSTAAAGLLLVLLGEAVRASVIGLVYIKRGGVNKRIYADQLVTTGMFSHCRNPLYVGNLVILSGFLVTHNNPWVYFLGGAFFLLSYAAIVMAEEEFLGNKFGEEYRDYCRRVPRWGFTFRNMRQTFRANRFSWVRVINKDYSTIMTWLVVLLVINTHNRVYPMQPADTGVIIQGAVAAALVVAAGAGVRILKKRGFLREEPAATEN
ncbi:MAG: isoprenylcysteine carboxylmethyltransferase family protein [Gammaproteobacteria bacterium]